MQSTVVILLAVLAMCAARDQLSIKSGAPSKDVYVDSIACLNGKISFKPDVYVGHLNKNCEGKKAGKCTLFCHVENVTPYNYRVLGPDGVPTKEGYAEFINSAVQSVHRDRVTKHVNGCIEKHASGVDINDSECEGAGKFYACINELWAFDCQ